MDVAYALRRGLVVTLVVMAVCGVVGLLSAGGSDYSSTAAVSLAVEGPSGSAVQVPAPGDGGSFGSDPDRDGVTFAPGTRDLRAGQNRSPGSQARAGAPPPRLTRARLRALAARAERDQVEARVSDEETIELEATASSKDEARRDADAAADAVVKRASRVRLGARGRSGLEATVTAPASSPTSTGGRSALGGLGLGLLIGLPLGLVVALALHLASLAEARRASEPAAGSGQE